MEDSHEVQRTWGDADLTAVPKLPRIEFVFYSAKAIIFPITSVHGDGAVINRKHFAPRNGAILPAR